VSVEIEIKKPDQPSLGFLGEVSVYCEALDEEKEQIGFLALAPGGQILVLEVEKEYRRQGIATAMFRELQAMGYRPKHDWASLSAEGAAWVSSLEKASL